MDDSLFVIKILTYLYFGDITERFIKAKQKAKIGHYSKILNNSKTDITFVDSLWRERISTEGFKVMGTLDFNHLVKEERIKN